MADDQDRRSRFLGSLKDALVAASREDDNAVLHLERTKLLGRPAAALPAPRGSASEGASAMGDKAASGVPSAAEAARDARGGPIVTGADRHIEMDPPTTRVVRGVARDVAAAIGAGGDEPAERTQFVRGRQKVERTTFHQDPVVAWLVVVGGPGLGAYRPVYEGNNTLGRSSQQRIPIDFGDDAISSEEQAYIRYDSADRTFLFVPNLAKTNVVSVNDKKPTSAVPLAAMDVIGVGRTQLVFVPFCGPDFDWSELSDGKVTRREARAKS
jgi:hypothetical protein